MKRAISFWLLLIAASSAPWANADDAERQDLARQLFDATGMSERVGQTMTALFHSMDAAYREMYAKLATELAFPDDETRSTFMAAYAENAAAFSESLQTRFGRRIDVYEEARRSLAPVYAELYSESELRELLDFYRSPLGQKVAREQPVRMAGGMQQLLTVLTPVLQEVLQQRLVAERERLTAAVARPGG